MGKPLATACAANADKYLGRKYSEMDCQAYIERLLADVGIVKNWAGSNAMLRDTSSFRDMGTPEECIKALGCIPTGAMVGIWEESGAPSKYSGDGKGNLNHIGIKTGSGKGAVHSSASRGCVAQSEFHDKTIRNGGWNRVLLCLLLDYGSSVESKLGNASSAQAADDTPTITTVGVGGTLATLRRGSKGSDVVALQSLLRGQGYPIEADGDFGKLTEGAVKSYQASKGLEADGVVGRMTWAALQAGDVSASASASAEGKSEGSNDNSVTIRSLHGEEARYLLEKYAAFGACVVTVTGLTDAEACYLLETYPMAESGSTEGFG